MIKQIDLRADRQVFAEIKPDLRFGEEGHAFAFFFWRGSIAMVFVLRPDGEVAGHFQLIIEQAFPPVEGVEKILAGSLIRCIPVIELCREICCFPLEGAFGAGRESILNIIAVLFWFGDAAAAAALQG